MPNYGKNHSMFARGRIDFLPPDPTVILVFLFAMAIPHLASATDPAWIVPSTPDSPLIWGRKDGIIFGLPSKDGLPGPRGLVRVGVISPQSGKPQLLNFIAIEPVVAGPGTRSSRMAFSELEFSELDRGTRGKRLWVAPGAPNGQVEQVSSAVIGNKPIERLSLRIEVEPFTANNAQVYLVASIDGDRPNELNVAVYQRDPSSRHRRTQPDRYHGEL